MTQNGDEWKAVIDARLEDLDVIRLPRVSQAGVDKPHERQEVTASIHNADLAPVRALAPTADSVTLVPAPGHRAIAGSRALPHPSCARNLWSPRMGRVCRCLTICPPQNMADG